MHAVPPDTRIDLSDHDAAGHPLCPEGKEVGRERSKGLQERLEALQELLYAEGRRRVLVVLQGMDTAGKDGVIRHVFEGVNPQGVRVASFKRPTPEELAHDYLWRVHRHVPGNGEITIFNRSHYEDVLVVRVHGLVPEAVWSRRYEQINAFEHMLAEEGTTILKYFLHISPAEQAERLRARRDDPAKQWKFSLGDLAERRHWEAYRAAYEAVLSETSTPWAPWHIVPSDRKWYRNLVIGESLVATLEGFGMAHPAPEPGIADAEIV